MEVKIPNHVGIIVDGNGRWAKQKNLSRSKGHLEGFKNMKRLMGYIFKKDINILSLYVFSTENFKRSKIEVDYIMNLVVKKLPEILDTCHESKAKVLFSGTYDNLSKEVIKTIEEIKNQTKDYTNKTLNICFNYGSRKEIVDTCKKLNELNLEYTEENFNNNLYNELPDIDFLIRTSGEQRISNFMLWQCAYAEFYFEKKYFPDFKEEDFDKALISYTKRDRRFGGIK